MSSLIIRILEIIHFFNCISFICVISLKARLHRAILSRDKSCDRTAILRGQQIARVNSRRFHSDL